jgi:hypothetical protein
MPVRPSIADRRFSSLLACVEPAGQIDQRGAHADDALHRADFGAEHDFADRLDQVIVAAGRDALLDVLVAGHRRQEDDRHPALLRLDRPDALRDLMAVDVGQHDVEQHQIGLFGSEGGDRRLAAGDRYGPGAEGFDILSQQQQAGTAVLDDQYLHGGRPVPAP